MGAMASQITSLTIVYSTVYSGADQRKHQSPASLAFVRGIHRWPVNSPHKGPVTRKMYPSDDVIMIMGIPMLERWHIFIETGPWSRRPTRRKQTTATMLSRRLHRLKTAPSGEVRNQRFCPWDAQHGSTKLISHLPGETIILCVLLTGSKITFAKTKKYFWYPGVFNEVWYNIQHYGSRITSVKLFDFRNAVYYIIVTTSLASNGIWFCGFLSWIVWLYNPWHRASGEQQRLW